MGNLQNDHCIMDLWSMEMEHKLLLFFVQYMAGHNWGVTHKGDGSRARTHLWQSMMSWSTLFICLCNGSLKTIKLFSCVAQSPIRNDRSFHWQLDTLAAFSQRIQTTQLLHHFFSDFKGFKQFFFSFFFFFKKKINKIITYCHNMF